MHMTNEDDMVMMMMIHQHHNIKIATQPASQPASDVRGAKAGYRRDGTSRTSSLSRKLACSSAPPSPAASEDSILWILLSSDLSLRYGQRVMPWSLQTFFSDVRQMPNFFATAFSGRCRYPESSSRPISLLADIFDSHVAPSFPPNAPLLPCLSTLHLLLSAPPLSLCSRPAMPLPPPDGKKNCE